VAHQLEVIGRECEGGSGYPPLLFVHGSCHAAWCWDEYFLPYFASHGFDAYALSLRGHGASGGPWSLRWTSIADYVADVEQVAAELPGDPVVIGHSLGGFIVQKYLERHEAPGAVLVAPAPAVGMLAASMRMSRQDPLLSLQLLLSLEPYTMFATPERARRFLFSPDVDDDTLHRYWSRLGRESFRSWTQMLTSRPDAERIRRTPALILAGGGDRLIPEAALRRTADLYGADLTLLPDTAHDIMLEKNWRQAADATLDWLHRTLTPA
jgi:hypothetical protein